MRCSTDHHNGNFSEYYSDMDCILDDALWKVGDWTDSRAWSRCRSDAPISPARPGATPPTTDSSAA
jgi:hypothetical protein